MRGSSSRYAFRARFAITAAILLIRLIKGLKRL